MVGILKISNHICYHLEHAHTNIFLLHAYFLIIFISYYLGIRETYYLGKHQHGSNVPLKQLYLERSIYIRLAISDPKNYDIGT